MNKLNKILNSNKFEAYGGIGLVIVILVVVIVLMLTVFRDSEAEQKQDDGIRSQYIEYCVQSEPRDGDYTEDQARGFCTCAFDHLVGDSDDPAIAIDNSDESDETRAALACMSAAND